MWPEVGDMSGGSVWRCPDPPSPTWWVSASHTAHGIFILGAGTYFDIIDDMSGTGIQAASGNILKISLITFLKIYFPEFASDKMALNNSVESFSSNNL